MSSNTLELSPERRVVPGVAFVGLIAIGIVGGPLFPPWLAAALASVAFAVFLTFVDTGISIHVMLLVGFSTFLFVPAIANAIMLGTSFQLLYLSLAVGWVLLRFTGGLHHRWPDGPIRNAPTGFILLSIYVVSMSFINAAWVSPVFVLYLILFVLSLASRTLMQRLFLLAVFMVAFGVYALIGWTGFGRTVLGGWLIVAILYFCYATGLRVNKVLFAFVPAIGSMAMTSRSALSYGFVEVEMALEDSTFSPYRLASTFLSRNAQGGFDIHGFWDQVIFSLFVFVPRDVWPAKPYGFGFEYTVRELETYLVEAGHSIAGTLIGDHLFYLGYFGVATGVVMALVLAQLSRMCHNIKSLYGTGLVIVASSMPVLVWGGMSSFAARIALPALVVLAVLPLVPVVFRPGSVKSRSVLM